MYSVHIHTLLSNAPISIVPKVLKDENEYTEHYFNVYDWV